MSLSGRADREILAVLAAMKQRELIGGGSTPLSLGVRCGRSRL
jgi:hypothetical protein